MPKGGLAFLMDSARTGATSEGGSTQRTGYSGASSARSGSSSARSGGSTARTDHNIYGQRSGKKRQAPGEVGGGGGGGAGARVGGGSGGGRERKSSDPTHKAAHRTWQLEVYSKMLAKAKNVHTDKHVTHLKDLKASDRLPKGRVSNEIYDGIWTQRKFDKYGRLIPAEMTEKQRKVEKLKKTMAANAAPVDEKPGGPIATSKNQLKTDKFKIGIKKPVHGPVGAAPQPAKILNSEGNEDFYSYDGYWRNGKMHGIGTYQFADGCTYSGEWEKGRQHGTGTAIYDTGHRYEGQWNEGYFHGKGVMRYSTGITYDGEWKRGTRHGHGKLVFPSGFTYDGEWVVNKMHGYGEVYSELTDLRFHGHWSKGFINGNGTLVVDVRTAISRSWRTAGGMTFNELVQYIHEDKLAQRQELIDDYLKIHGIRVSIETQNHVTDVKTQLYEDRKEAREAELNESRAKAAEARRKQKEALMSSLLGKMDEIHDQASASS